jgi:hypothetical protein
MKIRDVQKGISKKPYINTNNEAKALIQLILAPIEFLNSILIHNEKVLINAFITSVSYSESKIYDITFSNQQLR